MLRNGGLPSERRRKMGEQNSNPRFTPYATMFKLQLGLQADGPRVLECVHCGDLLSWRFYKLAPERFDAECQKCGMSLEDYWKDKNSRKVGLDDS